MLSVIYDLTLSQKMMRSLIVHIYQNDFVGMVTFAHPEVPCTTPILIIFLLS